MEKTRRLKTFSIVALIVAVLGLTIAFAALSKTLTINGTGSVDAANWDIHFKNISEPTLTGKATTTGTPSLADNGATINDMKVSLKEPGDKVVYTVDIENSGDINAEIDSITLPEFTTAQSNILDFKAVYTSNNKEISQGDILEAKETKNVTITIMYKDITDESLLPKEGISVNLKYELHFVQTNKVVTTTVNYPTYSVGEKFCLNNDKECFYVISDNGDTVTAMAAYSLNTSSNVQSASCDMMKFSGSNYWSSNVSDYPSFVFDENSNLWQPLQNYKYYLENTLEKPLQEITLLSYEQALDLWCDESTLDGGGYIQCPSLPSWAKPTSAIEGVYWLGSARNASFMYVIFPTKIANVPPADNYCKSCLRPVITISKSEL